MTRIFRKHAAKIRFCHPICVIESNDKEWEQLPLVEHFCITGQGQRLCLPILYYKQNWKLTTLEIRIWKILNMNNVQCMETLNILLLKFSRPRYAFISETFEKFLEVQYFAGFNYLTEWIMIHRSRHFNPLKRQQ